jgi:CRISPR-associated protein Cmr1
MRYWQRALVGGLAPLAAVREIESAVFGSTDRGSAVIVRVSAPSHKPAEFTEQISVRAGGMWRATGKGYLLWTMARSGRVERDNFKAARWCFPTGTTFRVTLGTRGTDTTRLDQAVVAFWLLTQLGGIGSRARRCAGSLAVQEVAGNYTSSVPFFLSEHVPQDARALKSYLEDGIKEARKMTRPTVVQALEREVAARKLPPEVAKQELAQKMRHPAQHTDGSSFDILAAGICRIWILQDTKPWYSAETAMTGLGESLQEYRSHIPIEQRKIFGLPLPPQIFNRRRASPLLLRVVELQHGCYAGLAVLFKTTTREVSLTDYQRIDTWIGTFRDVQEVLL